MVSELMNTENKQWKSFEEQLQLLKSRGLLVDDEQAALDYLERIGYYRLSGYWYSFRQLILSTTEAGKVEYYRKDEFAEHSHFEDAVKLYVFDKKLRLLAMDALERIELAVRVDIAHLLGEIDTYAHHNPTVFHGNFAKRKIKSGKHKGQTEHELWLDYYEYVLHRARREPYVKHYMVKYRKLPIWVAVETWDFGMMSKIYAGMSVKHKGVIAHKYGVTDWRVFEGWLKSLNFIRNVSAHHSRLWNINVLELSKPTDLDEYWQRLDNTRPFFYFCVIQALMNTICPNSHWKKRFISLIDEFPAPKSNTVKVSDFGLIEDWKNWGLWR